jgi:hypothetical protein
MLAHVGYQIVYANDGAEAIDRYLRRWRRRAVRCGHPGLTIPGGMGKEEWRDYGDSPNAKAIVSSRYAHGPIMADYRTTASVEWCQPYRTEELCKVGALQ